MEIDYQTRAKNLPYKDKKEQFEKYYSKENLFHYELKAALQKIYPNATIVIRQGTGEKGKDVVMVQPDKLGNKNTTAYVVKMAKKLNGSATGKLAELVVQVTQCFKLPVKIEDYRDDIMVNKVVIVIAGTITDGAEENILSMFAEAPYKNNVSFVGMSALISMFEDNYPEFFFSKELRRLFKDRIEKIERFLIDEKELKYFIEPNIKKFAKTKQEIINASTTDGKNDLKRIAEQIFGKKESFSDFLEMVTNLSSKNILLSGDAGSGKSVLVYKLILTYLNKFLSDNPTLDDVKNIILPVCLKATEFSLDNIANFEEIIESYYLGDDSNVASVIIIDGIDEVEHGLRIAIKANLEAYRVLKNKNVNIVVTTRNNFGILEQFDNYEHYELMPYGYSQAIQFMKKMVKDDDLLVGGLEESIKQLEGQIPLYPMALKLLIEVVKQSKEIPASITLLYSRYVGMALGEFNFGAEIDQLFQPKIKKAFFAELAYKCFYKNGLTEISLEQFRTFIKSFFEAHSFLSDIGAFSENIMRTALLRNEGSKIFFAHKSFLDYFIATYFMENKDDMQEDGTFSEIYDLFVGMNQWEDVVYYYFGLKSKVSRTDYEMLKKCIEKNDTELSNYIDVYFMGRLMQYSWQTASDIKEESILGAMDIADKTKNAFHTMFKDTLKLEIPQMISGINLLHLIGICFSSTFLRSEVKKLITQTREDIDAKDEHILFSVLYLISNVGRLEIEYVKDNIDFFLPKIDKMEHPENTVFLFSILDAFKDKNKVLSKTDLKKKIIEHTKDIWRKYPKATKALFTAKKDGFKQLRKKLLDGSNKK